MESITYVGRHEGFGLAHPTIFNTVGQSWRIQKPKNTQKIGNLVHAGTAVIRLALGAA